MAENVFVQVGRTVQVYTCNEFSGSNLRIGHYRRNSQVPIRYNFRVTLDDNNRQFDAFRLAIQTHALGELAEPHEGSVFSIDPEVHEFCNDAPMPDVLRQVLGFLILVRLETLDGVSLKSVMCSVAGSVDQIVLALELLRQSGGPVQELKPEVYGIGNIWLAIEILDSMKSLP